MKCRTDYLEVIRNECLVLLPHVEEMIHEWFETGLIEDEVERLDFIRSSVKCVVNCLHAAETLSAGGV